MSDYEQGVWADALAAALPPEPPPAQPVCCPWCGTRVLHGQAPDGTPLVLDLGRRTWRVTHQEGSSVPRLVRARGYGEHQCAEDGIPVDGAHAPQSPGGY